MSRTEIMAISVRVMGTHVCGSFSSRGGARYVGQVPWMDQALGYSPDATCQCNQCQASSELQARAHTLVFEQRKEKVLSQCRVQVQPDRPGREDNIDRVLLTARQHAVGASIAACDLPCSERRRYYQSRVNMTCDRAPGTYPVARYLCSC
jgi:hypothetical protein